MDCERIGTFSRLWTHETSYIKNFIRKTLPRSRSLEIISTFIFIPLSLTRRKTLRASVESDLLSIYPSTHPSIHPSFSVYGYANEGRKRHAGGWERWFETSWKIYGRKRNMEWSGVKSTVSDRVITIKWSNDSAEKGIETSFPIERS